MQSTILNEYEFIAYFMEGVRHRTMRSHTHCGVAPVPVFHALFPRTPTERASVGDFHTLPSFPTQLLASSSDLVLPDAAVESMAVGRLMDGEKNLVTRKGDS